MRKWRGTAFASGARSWPPGVAVVHFVETRNAVLLRNRSDATARPHRAILFTAAFSMSSGQQVTRPKAALNDGGSSDDDGDTATAATAAAAAAFVSMAFGV
jgi:hypothetical protein